MDKFLEKYNPPGRMRYPELTSNKYEIEIIIEKLPTERSPGPDGFTADFYLHSKKKWY